MISRFSPRWGLEISTLMPARKDSASASSAFSGISSDSSNLRRGALVIELADEGFQHFRQLHVGGMAGEIGPVAPILSGAEKEHLDAGVAAFAVGGEQIGFVEGGRD